MKSLFYSILIPIFLFVLKIESGLFAQNQSSSIPRILILDLIDRSQNPKFKFIKSQLPFLIKQKIITRDQSQEYYFPDSRLVHTVLKKKEIPYSKRNLKKNLKSLVQILDPHLLIYGHYEIVSSKLKIYIYIVDVQKKTLVNRSYHLFEGNINQINFREKLSSMASRFVALENFVDPKPKPKPVIALPPKPKPKPKPVIALPPKPKPKPKPVIALPPKPKPKPKPVIALPPKPKFKPPTSLSPKSKNHYLGIRTGLPIVIDSSASQIYNNLPYFGIFYQYAFSKLFFLESEIGFYSYQKNQESFYFFPIAFSPSMYIRFLNDIFLVPQTGIGFVFSNQGSIHLLFRPSLGFVGKISPNILVSFAMTPLIKSKFSNLFSEFHSLFLINFSIYFNF